MMPDSMPYKRHLPGDVRATRASALRVDHAGEYGAQRIYAGQLAVLGKTACGDELRHMAAQEEAHLAFFKRILPEERVRPSLLQPIWHVAGYALGVGTALLGEKAAMACTVAVESVITEHYTAQLEAGNMGEKLSPTITRFRDEEMEHHAIGLAHGAEHAKAYGLLTGVIRAGCTLAIRLAERV